MKKILLFTLLSLFLTACTSSKTVMEQGKLIDLKFVEDELKFAFLDSNKEYYSNYEYDLNYKIVIDDNVKKPEVAYPVMVKTLGNATKKEINIDSLSTIKIILSREDYYKVFGKPIIPLDKE